MFILTMHPHVIGHRSRVAMLERLVQHMRSRPGVWFATHEQIARFVSLKKSERWGRCRRLRADWTPTSSSALPGRLVSYTIPA